MLAEIKYIPKAMQSYFSNYWKNRGRDAKYISLCLKEQYPYLLNGDKESGKPDPCYRWLEKANTALNKQFLDEAEFLTKLVMKVDPTDLQAYFILGGVYLQKRKYLEAEQCFNKILRAVPDDMASWANKGLALVRQRKVAQGVKCLNKALEICPDEISVLNFLAEAKCYMNDYEGALKDVKKSYRLNPRNPSTKKIKAAVEKLVAQHSKREFAA